MALLVQMNSVSYSHYTSTCFSQSLLKQGSDAACEPLLAALRPASQEAVAALACREGEQVIHPRTLLRQEDVPVCITPHFLPQLAGWSQLQHYRSGSLHDFLQQRQQPLSLAQTRISTHCVQAQASRLSAVPLQAPLPCIRTLRRGADGQLAEYAARLTRGEMTELMLEHQAKNNGEE